MAKYKRLSEIQKKNYLQKLQDREEIIIVHKDSINTQYPIPSNLINELSRLNRRRDFLVKKLMEFEL